MLTFNAQFEPRDEFDVQFAPQEALKTEFDADTELDTDFENLMLVHTGGSGELLPATRTRLGGVIVGSNLNVTEDGTLSVDMANDIEKDNTRPISSAHVYTSIGNINALLGAI